MKEGEGRRNEEGEKRKERKEDGLSWKKGRRTKVQEQKRKDGRGAMSTSRNNDQSVANYEHDNKA